VAALQLLVLVLGEDPGLDVHIAGREPTAVEFTLPVGRPDGQDGRDVQLGLAELLVARTLVEDVPDAGDVQALRADELGGLGVEVGVDAVGGGGPPHERDAVGLALLALEPLELLTADAVVILAETELDESVGSHGTISC
jgi:hypothetical protein